MLQHHTSQSCRDCQERLRMAATFSRGAHTMNTIFIKPVVRKGYHRKSSTMDSVRETVRFEAEEEVMRNKSQSNNVGDNDGTCWVPHERTGIYYPKGQEKVIEDVPPGAARDFGVHWYSRNH